MSATNETGALAAPSRATVEDAVEHCTGTGVTMDFLLSLAGKIEPLVIPTDGDGYILEAAYQLGFDTVDDDGALFIVSGTKLIEFVKRMRGPGGVRIGADGKARGGVRIGADGKARGDVSDEQIEVVLSEALADVRKRSGQPDPADETLKAYRAQHMRLIRELDVALNGEAGAAAQAAMCDLIAQVERQQCVQILNLADGFRLNFRAPNGERATLFLDRLLAHYNIGDSELVKQVMRNAIAAYPVAGVSVPVEREQQFGLYVDTMTETQRERAAKVYDHFDHPFDSHPENRVAQIEAMNLYVRTGALPKPAGAPLPAECPGSADGKHHFFDNGGPCMACGVPL